MADPKGSRSAHARDKWAASNRRVDLFLRETLRGTMPSADIYRRGKEEGFTKNMIHYGRLRNGIVCINVAGAWYWVQPAQWVSGAHARELCSHTHPIPDIVKKTLDCVMCKRPIRAKEASC